MYQHAIIYPDWRDHLDGLMQLSNITMTKRPEFSYFIAIWSHCDHIVEEMWSLILGVITVGGCDHTVITPLSKMITNFSVITGVITCFSLWPQNIFNGGTSIPLPLNSNFIDKVLWKPLPYSFHLCGCIMSSWRHLQREKRLRSTILSPQPKH